MLPLVDIPDIVQHYAPFFASVFSPQAFQQFQRYLSGLILSENKTVERINRLFVLDTRHQSSLNRLLTESPFDLKKLHQARLALLQSLPRTQMKPKDVLSEAVLKLLDQCFQPYRWFDLIQIVNQI